MWCKFHVDRTTGKRVLKKSSKRKPSIILTLVNPHFGRFIEEARTTIHVGIVTYSIKLNDDDDRSISLYLFRKKDDLINRTKASRYHLR